MATTTPTYSKDPAAEDNSSNSRHSSSSSSSPTEIGLASYQEVLSFGNGWQTKLLMIGGIITAIFAGALGPFMIWYFAQSFEELSADPTTDGYLENVKEVAFAFLVLGSLAFCSLSLYSTLLQTAAGQMTMDLKTQWYQALLRQDLAFFDIQDISGTATTISTNGAKFQRGVGNKLGLFAQFIATFLGGMIYAFYSSWQTSLVVLLTVPFMAISGRVLVKITTSQSQRKNASYAEAGAIVYTTVTNIRTILSLNGAQAMIDKFQAGTALAYRETVSQVNWLGLANGSLMSSFLLSSIVVPLFGGYLLYDQVRNDGCDPSGAVPDVPTCDPSGVDIFGAMFGIFFAASVIPQITTTLEAINEARAACFLALQVMNRKVEDASREATTAAVEPNTRPAVRRYVGQANAMVSLANLPKYEIDSSSLDGKKLDNVQGSVEFHQISFSYPTRMETQVFHDFSLQIPAGTTIALVGSSGSGKSTIAQLVERFYDPTSGSITLDGHDLKDLNLAWLRQHIGLVSQEPALFAATIRENIAYGLPGGTVGAAATMEQIIEAAKVANAHDFILDFPNGYETQVGDKGAKLSGGQKQRIAIARTIIKNPKILVLDEATSALDSESERVVQTAIDKLLESKNRTTIVIAHRLSTVRNADVIAVLENGKVVEMGSHDELIQKQGKYDALVQAQQRHPETTTDSDDRKSLYSKPASGWSSRTSSSGPEVESSNGNNGDELAPVLRFRNVQFAYPTRPDSTILSDFNLSVRSGETLALVGPSGHGKSTVIQLIERFYDPSEGVIELEDVDLRKCNPHWLRDQIGLVSQEPALFDQTIAENIRFGLPHITQDQIEQAAKDANAHDFIMTFPDGYNTQVGDGGTQVSGGQKQRICIARVLLRQPRLLLLDEATSALDSESERAVQEALDKIMAMEHQSTIVIAHRLSTIRNADRIAVIVEGTIKELGTYEELMSKEHGYFRRLQAFQNFDGFVPSDEVKESGENDEEEPETEAHMKEKIEKLKRERRAKKEKEQMEEEELKAIDKEREKRNANRSRQLAKGDEGLFLIGGIGAILTGAVFPAWGFLFAYMIELLFTAVVPCDLVGADTPAECQAYHDSVANDMNELAKDIAWGSVGTIVACMLGYTILFYGFGTATERMNKRVRDQTYSSLIRQEVAYFDAMPAGKLTTQLQDDAALIHSFSGEPIRTLMINVSSVLVGLVIGFVFMWPFALVFLGILPFLGFGAEMEMKMYVTGEDEGDDAELLEDEHSPGGIVVESLLNIRTVASLTLEETKLFEFRKSLEAENPRPMLNNFLKGSGFGLGQFFQFYGIALMIWFGAWLLNNFPEKYSFRDFIISMFGLFFSLYGLTVALEGATDRNKAKLAADRIFSLIDRRSAIDPLAEQGTKGVKLHDSDNTSEEEVEK